MRSVSSAFWAGLQRDDVRIAELVDLETAGVTYRWTTANAPLQVGSYTYDPFPGNARDGAEESTDLGVGTLAFTMANTGSLQTLLAANGLDQAPIAVSRVLTNSPNLGRMYVFRGRLGDIVYDRLGIGGQVRNSFQGVNGRFPYYNYQDYCVWRFGSPGCGVDVSSYTVNGTVLGAASNPIYVTANPGPLPVNSPGWFDRGRITFTSGANSGHMRAIRAQSGDVMILSHAVPYQIEDGASFAIFPGCRKRLVEDCWVKYDNTVNFLGFPWIPKAENAF